MSNKKGRNKLWPLLLSIQRSCKAETTKQTHKSMMTRKATVGAMHPHTMAKLKT